MRLELHGTLIEYTGTAPFVRGLVRRPVQDTERKYTSTEPTELPPPNSEGFEVPLCRRLFVVAVLVHDGSRPTHHP